jgi:hypothetical protein
MAARLSISVFAARASVPSALTLRASSVVQACKVISSSVFCRMARARSPFYYHSTVQRRIAPPTMPSADFSAAITGLATRSVRAPGHVGESDCGFAPCFFRAPPRRFANPSPPSGWIKDFHLQAVDHARHTKKAAFRGFRCLIGHLEEGSLLTTLGSRQLAMAAAPDPHVGPPTGGPGLATTHPGDGCVGPRRPSKKGCFDSYSLQ